MLQVLDVCGPSPKQWEMVVRGIRNPFKGQSGGDSNLFVYKPNETEKIDYAFYETIDKESGDYRKMTFEEAQREVKCSNLKNLIGVNHRELFYFGPKDLKLAKNLANAGPDHGKFLRELPVIIECRAPLFWWKQLDAYRVGVPAMNSESTMHTIHKKEFELSDFSYSDGDVENFLKGTIVQLNRLRDDYLELEEYEKEFKNGDRTRWPIFMWDWEEVSVDETVQMDDEELVELVKGLKKDVWMAMIEMLPESYFQTRTFITTYAGLRNMFGQRVVKPHKLPEWREFFQHLALRLPYFTDLIVGNQSPKNDENEKVIFVIKGNGEKDPSEFWEKVKKDRIIKLENNNGEDEN